MWFQSKPNFYFQQLRVVNLFKEFLFLSCSYNNVNHKMWIVHFAKNKPDLRSVI